MQAFLEDRTTALLQLRKRGVGAEIGVHEGNFSLKILQIAQPTKLFLIDPWEYQAELSESLYGGDELSQEKLDKRYARVCRKLSTPIKRGRVEVLRKTSSEALQLVESNSLDFVYIDGDHRYEAVREDLFEWYGKVKVGGLLLADDYRNANWWGDGVIRACHDFLSEAKVEIAFKVGSQIGFTKLD